MYYTAQQESNRLLRAKVLKGKYVPKSVKKAIASRERMIANGLGYHWKSHRYGSEEKFNLAR